MTQPIDFRAHPLAGYSLLTHPIHSRSSTSGHWILKEGINFFDCFNWIHPHLGLYRTINSRHEHTE